MMSLSNMSTKYPGDPHHYIRSLKGYNYKSFLPNKKTKK